MKYYCKKYKKFLKDSEVENKCKLRNKRYCRNLTRRKLK